LLTLSSTRRESKQNVVKEVRLRGNVFTSGQPIDTPSASFRQFCLIRFNYKHRAFVSACEDSEGARFDWSVTGNATLSHSNRDGHSLFHLHHHLVMQIRFVNLFIIDAQPSSVSLLMIGICLLIFF
jgi:hypothetical protein